MISRMWLAAISATVTAWTLPAQDIPIPPHLKLAGDPAAAIDLGATRPVPMPKRSEDGKTVIAAPYCCLTSLAARDQNEPTDSRLRAPEFLLGRPRSSVLTWLEKISLQKPHIVMTPHAVLVSLLPAGAASGITPEEAVRLRAFFPSLPRSSLTQLPALTQAHLWALRLLTVEAELTDLLGLDERGDLPREDVALPLAHGRVEIYLFATPRARDLFTEFIFARDTRAVLGQVVEDGARVAPAAAIVVTDDDAGSRRRFAHGSAWQLLLRLRRPVGGVPDWLRLGIAHYLERRGDAGGPQASGTLPESFESPKDWDRAAADLVHGNRTSAFAAMTLTPERALSLESRIEAHSAVKYLIGLDRERFARLIRQLYVASPEADPSKSLLESVRATYDTDIRGLELGWKHWVSFGRRR